MTRAALLLLLAASGVARAQTGQLTPLVETGPAGERINIVVVAEGYTEAQLGQFRADAARVSQRLLTRPPYSVYSGLFNVYAIGVASRESGADHPSRGVFRDTAFDAAYDCGGIERRICVGNETAVYTVLAQTFPVYDVVLLLVNDRDYGGSGGAIPVASVHPDSPEIAIHELGHSFARLSDEYGGTGSGFTALNTSQSSARADLPWAVWVSPETLLPTPETGVAAPTVGAFRGAAYSDFGAYRPQAFCGMRTLATAFCAVCRQYIIAEMYRRVSPVGTVAPAVPSVETTGGPLVFSVSPLTPPDRRQVEWRVDGVLVPTSSETLTLTDVPPGAFTVEVRVADVATEVRDADLLPLMSDTYTWTVTPGTTSTESAAAGTARFDAVWPNPARTSAQIQFRLSAPSHVRMRVTDVLGREVAVLTDEPRAAGSHRIDWSVAGLPGGVYTVALETADGRMVRRLSVVH